MAPTQCNAFPGCNVLRWFVHQHGVNGEDTVQRFPVRASTRSVHQHGVCINTECHPTVTIQCNAFPISNVLRVVRASTRCVHQHGVSSNGDDTVQRFPCQQRVAGGSYINTVCASTRSAHQHGVRINTECHPTATTQCNCLQARVEYVSYHTRVQRSA